MHERDRLRQIRVLRERLERLPASAERDWMLGEVRRRVVDVESGLRAAPLRPLVEDVEAEEAERPPATAAVPERTPADVATRTRSTPARTRSHVPSPREASATSVARAVTAAAATAPPIPLQEGLMLCLDDDVVVAAEPGRHRPTSPWARGLRG